MTALPTTQAPVTGGRATTRAEKRAADAKTKLSSPSASAIAVILAILWTIPTFGLLLSSFRPELLIRTKGWWMFFSDPQLTLDNYETVLFDSSTQLSTYFVNSLAITLPSVVIPVTLALLAAYAFAWVEFRFRHLLFVAVFALQIVPIQITLIPLLKTYVDGPGGLVLDRLAPALDFRVAAGDFPAAQLHARCATRAGGGRAGGRRQARTDLLPGAAALARTGDSGVLDLPVPVGLERPAGGVDVRRRTPNVAPLTVRVAELVGTRGTEWHLLASGAFVAMVVPLIVFLSLQRYFVRGLLAGSVKG